MSVHPIFQNVIRSFGMADAQERANTRTNAEVGRKARQLINSAMSGLRSELMALASGLSLDVIDEYERQVIGAFGPTGAYQDFVSDITHDILPDEPAVIQQAAE